MPARLHSAPPSAGGAKSRGIDARGSAARAAESERGRCLRARYATKAAMRALLARRFAARAPWDARWAHLLRPEGPAGAVRASEASDDRLPRCAGPIRARGRAVVLPRCRAPACGGRIVAAALLIDTGAAGGIVRPDAGAPSAWRRVGASFRVLCASASPAFGTHCHSRERERCPPSPDTGTEPSTHTASGVLLPLSPLPSFRPSPD